MNTERVIVEIVKSAATSLLGRLFHEKTTAITPAANEALFVCFRDAAGQWVAESVASAADVESTRAHGAQVVRVNLALQDGWRFSCSDVLKDAQGCSHDLILYGTWRVADTQAFLTRYALNFLTENVPLTRTMVEEWLAAHHLRPRLRMIAQEFSVAGLQAETVTAGWFQQRCQEWLAGSGIIPAILRFELVSADKQRVEAERRQEEEFKRLTTQQEQKHKLELAQLQQQAAYEEQKRKIELDAQLSEKQRQLDIELLEKEHLKRKVSLDGQILDEQRKQEIATLEHQKRMAEIQRDTKAVQETDKRMAEMAQKHSEMVVAQAKTQETLTQLLGPLTQLLNDMLNAKQGKQHQAVEKAVNEHGLDPVILQNLGVEATSQSFLEQLSQQANRHPQRVVVEKHELQTRDIGGKHIKALPINSSLQLQFTTRRSGYVTLLNIGTSGAIYLHVPNPYLADRDTRVIAGETHQIPGSWLLPWEGLRRHNLDYVEIGPPGWEHLAVIISDQPVVNRLWMIRSTPQNPFLKLGENEVQTLSAHLNSLPPDKWSAGVVSFLVE
jgi:hypothetical protein